MPDGGRLHTGERGKRGNWKDWGPRAIRSTRGACWPGGRRPLDPSVHPAFSRCDAELSDLRCPRSSVLNAVPFNPDAAWRRGGSEEGSSLLNPRDGKPDRLTVGGRPLN